MDYFASERNSNGKDLLNRPNSKEISLHKTQT